MADHYRLYEYFPYLIMACVNICYLILTYVVLERRRINRKIHTDALRHEEDTRK